MIIRENNSRNPNNYRLSHKIETLITNIETTVITGIRMADTICVIVKNNNIILFAFNTFTFASYIIKNRIMKVSNFKIRFWTLLFITSTVVMSQAKGQSTDTDDNHKVFEFGLRFMPTFTALDLHTSDGGTTRGSVNMGYGVGALVAFNITEHVGAQFECIYSNITQKFKEKDVDHKITLKYFNIPLLLSLNTGVSKMINLNLVAGPQIGVSAGAKIETTDAGQSTSPNPVLSIKKGDFGLVYGAGVDFGLNSARTVRLGLGYRGVFGLLDISDNSKTQTTNNYYVLDRSHIRTNAIYMGLSVRF